MIVLSLPARIAAAVGDALRRVVGSLRRRLLDATSIEEGRRIVRWRFLGVVLTWSRTDLFIRRRSGRGVRIQPSTNSWVLPSEDRVVRRLGPVSWEVLPASGRRPAART